MVGSGSRIFDRIREKGPDPTGGGGEEGEEVGEEDLGAGQEEWRRPDCQAGGTQQETGTRQWEGGEPGATAVSRREPGKSAARTRSRSRTSRQQGDKCPLHQLPECGGKN